MAPAPTKPEAATATRLREQSGKPARRRSSPSPVAAKPRATKAERARENMGRPLFHPRGSEARRPSEHCQRQAKKIPLARSSKEQSAASTEPDISYGTFARLAVAQKGVPDRVQQVQALLKDRFKKVRSGNILHGFRRMAYDVKDLDPDIPKVYPRQLAQFVGNLGVRINEKETLKLLARVKSAPALDQPFGITTFHNLVVDR